MTRINGCHIIDFANLFIHQINVIIYTLLNADIMMLQMDVTHKPRKIIVLGFIRSPIIPLKICPKP